MRPGQQSPRKWHVLGPGGRGGRGFNEAGATIAPEIERLEVKRQAEALASMRPGQQSPRKWVTPYTWIEGSQIWLQ